MNESVKSRKYLVASGIIVVAIVWVAYNIFDIRSHTLLQANRGPALGSISGVYRLRTAKYEPASRYRVAPFSNGIEELSELKISESPDGISIFKKEMEKWVLHVFLEYNEDVFWLDDDTLEYRIAPHDAGAAILPGIARDQIEGWLRLQENGDIRIEEVYWEKGIAVFVVPFLDESIRQYELEKIGTPE